MAIFHVTTTHDAAHCPGLKPELMPGVVQTLQNLDEIAARHGVTVHGFYSAAPAHFEIQILEAESLMAVTAFAAESAGAAFGEVDFDVVPVVSREELLQMAQAMMERQQ